MFKTYTCKGCGHSEEMDLGGKLTFPQCRKCCSIMAEPTHYSEEQIETIKNLETIWHHYYPNVPVQIQMIYRETLFKFRWFNGPSADEVRGNHEFIEDYLECAYAYGCEPKRIKHKRIFKRYLGLTKPAVAFEDLSDDKKVLVHNAIEKNIISVFHKTYAVGTVLEINQENQPWLCDCAEIREDHISDNLIQYECTSCKIAMDTDEEVINHIINYHL